MARTRDRSLLSDAYLHDVLSAVRNLKNSEILLGKAVTARQEHLLPNSMLLEHGR